MTGAGSCEQVLGLFFESGLPRAGGGFSETTTICLEMNILPWDILHHHPSLKHSVSGNMPFKYSVHQRQVRPYYSVTTLEFEISQVILTSGLVVLCQTWWFWVVGKVLWVWWLVQNRCGVSVVRSHAGFSLTTQCALQVFLLILWKTTFCLITDAAKVYFDKLSTLYYY